MLRKNINIFGNMLIFLPSIIEGITTKILEHSVTIRIRPGEWSYMNS